MTPPLVSKDWMSASELASLRLSCLPQSKQKVNALAKADGWAKHKSVDGEPLCRKRNASGGGLEYHIDVLPKLARRDLLLRRCHPALFGPDTKPERMDDALREAWEKFERLPVETRKSAEKRLAALRHYQRLLTIGFSHRVAVDYAAGVSGFAASSLWRWLAKLRSIPAEGWLPFLVIRKGKTSGQRAADHMAFKAVKSASPVARRRIAIMAILESPESAADFIAATLHGLNRLRVLELLIAAELAGFDRAEFDA